MPIHFDEPLAVMAAAALSLASAAVGAWWQRRRAPAPPDAAPGHLDARLIDARLDRLEQLAESTALDVERLAEGQRFTARLLAERATAATSPPSGVSVPRRPAEHRTPH